MDILIFLNQTIQLVFKNMTEIRNRQNSKSVPFQESAKLNMLIFVNIQFSLSNIVNFQDEIIQFGLVFAINRQSIVNKRPDFYLIEQVKCLSA
jgi:hypothetical protein